MQRFIESPIEVFEVLAKGGFVYVTTNTLNKNVKRLFMDMPPGYKRPVICWDRNETEFPKTIDVLSDLEMNAIRGEELYVIDVDA